MIRDKEKAIKIPFFPIPTSCSVLSTHSCVSFEKLLIAVLLKSSTESFPLLLCCASISSGENMKCL